MRTSKHSTQRITGFLNRVTAGMGFKELYRKEGFSEATFYKWRAKYAGLPVSKAVRLDELEAENGELKKLLADAHLDMHALKSVLGARR